MTAWFALYPYAGGGKASYLALLPALAGQHCHIPAMAGRDIRFSDLPHHDFGRLADDLWRQLAAELSDGRPVRDLVLYGYSMGALLATEMAARLEEQLGVVPRALVVAGAVAPHLLRGSGLSRLPDEEFVAELASVGVMPSEVARDPELVQLFLPVWRADCAALDSHPRRQVSLTCPVVALGGDKDALVDVGDLREWARVGGEGSAVHVVPGNHSQLMQHPGPVIDVLLAQVGPRGGTRSSSERLLQGVRQQKGN